MIGLIITGVLMFVVWKVIEGMNEKDGQQLSEKHQQSPVLQEEVVALDKRVRIRRLAIVVIYFIFFGTIGMIGAILVGIDLLGLQLLANKKENGIYDEKVSIKPVKTYDIVQSK